MGTPAELTVAVIGAGARGRSFAAACVEAGFRVVLEDVMPARLRQAELEMPGVSLVLTVEDAVREADVVVDFVPDELESKLEIWSLIDRMAPPKTVMCTPSEVLSVTDLASCTYRGDQCLIVRGLTAQAEIPGQVRLLFPAGCLEETIDLGRQVFSAIGCEVVVEADPDLPVLLKNMRADRL